MDDDVISSGVGMAMNDNATTVTEGALERARMLEAARKKLKKFQDKKTPSTSRSNTPTQLPPTTTITTNTSTTIATSSLPTTALLYSPTKVSPSKNMNFASSLFNTNSAPVANADFISIDEATEKLRQLADQANILNQQVPYSNDPIPQLSPSNNITFTQQPLQDLPISSSISNISQQNSSRLHMEIETQKQTIAVLVEEKNDLIAEKERLNTMVKELLAPKPAPTPFLSISSVHDRSNAKLEEALKEITELKHRLREKDVRMEDLTTLNSELADKCRKQAQDISNLETALANHQPAPRTNESASIAAQELAHYQQQISTLQNEVETKTDQLDSAYLQMSQIMTKVKDTEVQLEESQTKTSNLVATVESMKQENKRLKERLSSTEAELSSVKSEKLSMEKRMENIEQTEPIQRDDDTALESEVKELRSQLSVKLDELESLKAEKDRAFHMDSKVEGLSKQLASAQDRISRMSADNQALLDQLNELRARFVEINNEKAQLLDSLDTNKRQVTKLSQELETYSHYKAEIDKVRSLVRSEADIRGLQDDISKVTSQLSWTLEENDRLIRTVEYWRSLHDKVIADKAMEATGEMPSSSQNKSTAPPSPKPVKILSGKELEDLEVLRAENERLRHVLQSLGRQKQTELLAESTSNEGAPETESAETGAKVPAVELVVDETRIRELESKIQYLLESQRSLEDMVNAYKSQLVEEKHLNDLLQAEVDSLPDYIELYHRERKALIQQSEKSIRDLKSGFYIKFADKVRTLSKEESSPENVIQRLMDELETLSPVTVTSNASAALKGDKLVGNKIIRPLSCQSCSGPILEL